MSRDKNGEISESTQLPWQSPPHAVRIAEDFKTEGVTGLFYRGADYRGRPTDVFAWLGEPQTEKSLPAVLLIHGGGGTAFPEWVREWVQRGYVAIAPDTCGCVPGSEDMNRSRHAKGGPPGWYESFRQIADPVEDQWPYHAIELLKRAIDLLVDHPQVDASRIAVHGISWGGYLACTLAGCDARPAVFASSYGCAYRWDDRTVPSQEYDVDQCKAWCERWDANHFLGSASSPIHFTSAPDDFAFSLRAIYRSVACCGSQATLSIHPGMEHNQTTGAQSHDIVQFIDAALRPDRNIPYPSKITMSLRDDELVIDTDVPMPVFCLVYHTDQRALFSQDIKEPWCVQTYQYDEPVKHVSMPIPTQANVLLVTATDTLRRSISSNPVDLMAYRKRYSTENV